MNVAGSQSKCEWCGQPASTTLELEPAVWGQEASPSGKKIKIMRKRAIVAAVCPEHYSNLERSEKAKRAA